MAKAHVILVHGAQHQPVVWDPVIQLLQAAGHNTSAPRLPSASFTPPPSSMHEDTVVIKQAIVDAIDQGATSIVPVFHSYGGIPGSDALATLTPDQKTKIAKMLYISSFIVAKGSSLATVQLEVPWYSNAENGLVTCKDPISVFYNDVQPDDAAKAVEALVPTAQDAFLSPAQHEGWAEFPVTFVLCTEDNAWGPADQQRMIDLCRAREGRKGGPEAVEVVTLKSSHSPMLSMPEECVKIIRRAAGESV
ncbi:hypothetical protein Q7P37_004130 [Cladosporium fusiforme]